MADDTTTRTGDSTTDQPSTEDQGQDRTDQPEPKETDWKAQARKWEERAKANSTTAKERDQLRAELEKLQEQNQTEQEKAINAAKKAARDETLSEWKPKYEGLIRRNAALQMLGGRVKAPALVLPHLGLDSIEVDEEGNVDEAALKLAVDRVLDEYPFLATDSADDSSGASTHHGDMGPRRSTAKGKHDPDDLVRLAFGRR